MKTFRTVAWLSLPILVLALVSAGTRVFWQGTSAPYPFTTLRGETIMVRGHGLYSYDSISGAAQEVGQDVVTLIIGIPLLIAGLMLGRKGSLRGHLLLTGALGYFLYTYGAMSFLTAFNPFFLVYVALFSKSLFGFILALAGLDPEYVASRISSRFPRSAVIGYLLIAALFLTVAWLGLIVPSILTGSPPSGLDSYSTMVIQVLDLGVIVVAHRRDHRHSAVAAACLGLYAGLGCARQGAGDGRGLDRHDSRHASGGVPVDPVQTVLFAIISLTGIGLSAVTVRSVEDTRTEGVASLNLKRREFLKIAGNTTMEMNS